MTYTISIIDRNAKNRVRYVKVGRCPYAAKRKFNERAATLKSGYLDLMDERGNTLATYATVDHADLLETVG